MSLREKCSQDLSYLRKRVPTTKPEDCVGVANKLFELSKSDPAANCFGLAANQVGIDARVCVVTIPAMQDMPAFAMEFYNPDIIEWKGAIQNQEWCLSLPPNDCYVVRRYNNIRVKDDKNGITALKGIAAFAVQHEIDHLNGILICDKGRPLQKVLEIIKKTSKQPMNSLCFCGSGRKYKRCCYKLSESKETKHR